MATKNGKKVLLVDEYLKPGGGSTHWGTIPSKTIRQAVVALINIHKTPYVGYDHFNDRYTFKELINASKSVIKTQVKMYENLYTRNNIVIHHGAASFVDKNTVKITSGEFTEYFQAPYYVIATGSIPYHNPGVDYNHPLIVDSNTVLNLTKTPKSITIYGAGIIGVEYACIFKSLGIKVDIINTRDRVMDFLDDEIVDAFSYQARDLGIVIRNQESIKSIKADDKRVFINLESGKCIKHEYLLWAQGRVGNIKKLNLEAVGIKANNRGHLAVNEFYQTEVDSIYAVGDVVGWPNLASTAYDQGRIASAMICKVTNVPQKLGLFPTGIYTTPEISCIGKNERELTQKKISYEVGRANFKNIAKAQILGDTKGMLKILFHSETLEILGIHCFGRQAADIIHIGQAIMKQPSPYNTIKYFTETTFNYPTMAEAYRIAALNGLNRL
jgi:NAD(P) transhydrogenase